MRNMNCSLCAEAVTGRLHDVFLTDLAGLRLSRIVRETDNIFVVPSVGSLTKLHFLVCTKDHFNSLRDAPDHIKKSIHDEVQCLSDTITRKLGGHTLIIENGSATTNLDQPRCIDHVHVHVLHLGEQLPLPDTFTHDGEICLGILEVNESTISPNNDYIITGWNPDEMLVLQGPNIETQLMRKYVAQKLGIPGQWNWRDHPKINDIRTAISEYCKLTGL